MTEPMPFHSFICERPLRAAVPLLLCLLISCSTERERSDFDDVAMAGEVTPHSVILQSRLIVPDSVVGQVPGFGDLPGFAAWGRFEISADSTFRNSRFTDWQEAAPETDFMLKTAVTGLDSATRYLYRVAAGRDTTRTHHGRIATFRTLPAAGSTEDVRFIMISCMNYEKFFGLGSMQTQSDPAEWVRPAEGDDRRLGFPAFDAVLARTPDFWIANGDNVYYDSPTEQPEHHARTQGALRAKWHRQFAMPRFRRLAAQSPAFWLKDDHDYRFNDADTTDRVKAQPSHRLGLATFREQVPVVNPDASGQRTYRTHRVGDLLQVWFLEGRDYRSPNSMPDGPDKTLWGDDQKVWLKGTLLESDAEFKIIVSPTPIVGPDDASKRDNHANPEGFRTEGSEFIEWLAEHDLVSPRVFVLNGDRHWQYHSIHPSGLEEFSSGALVSQNARMGRAPGDPSSSDPLALIDQPYIQEVPVGGFLEVTVESGAAGGRPSILFTHVDERGKVLYAARRYSAQN